MPNPELVPLPEGYTLEQLAEIVKRHKQAQPRVSKKIALAPIPNERIFTDEQLVKGYTFCGENEWSWKWHESCMVFRVALGTGLRVSELRRLKVGETAYMEAGSGMLQIQSSKAPIGKIRTVEIIPELLPWWKARLQDYPYGEWFFVNSQTGEPVGKWMLQDHWNRVCSAAGIDNLRGIHGARHTYATWELKLKRRELWEMRRLLGHANILVTDEFYMHLMLGKNGTTPKWPDIAVQGFVRPSFKKPKRRVRK